jgi:type I restriction enzyme M protein
MEIWRATNRKRQLCLVAIVYSKLAPYGTAGVVLANGSMSSEIATEGQIRKELIENDLVDCMVSLPSQLFYNTQIPACLWFLARNKEGSKGNGLSLPLRNRTNEILFIDARELGTMISRKQKELSEKDIAKISDTYHNWRKSSELGLEGLDDDRIIDNNKKILKSTNPKNHNTDYVDIPGFCKSATIEDVRKNNYILTPGRYIDFKEIAEDGIAFDDKMGSLTLLLKQQMEKANELDEAIKLNLAKIGYEL